MITVQYILYIICLYFILSFHLVFYKIVILYFIFITIIKSMNNAGAYLEYITYKL